MYLFGFGGTYIPQGVFEQVNHPSISSSDFYLDSSQGTSWQATRQNSLPPLSDTSGPSNSRSATLLNSDVRNRDACFQGETRAGLWTIRDTHPPIAPPALPLVRFLRSACKYLRSSKQLSRLYRYPWPRPSHSTGSRYRKEIMITDASNGLSNH